MKPATLGFGISLLLSAPALSFAHGQPPAAAHGGQIQEANENWVELVVQGDQVKLYVLDESRQPVQSAKVSGHATILVDGKPYKVALSPAESNSLQGWLPVPAPGNGPATVSLIINGAKASARFDARS